jgi:hypothetical protein
LTRLNQIHSLTIARCEWLVFDPLSNVINLTLESLPDIFDLNLSEFLVLKKLVIKDCGDLKELIIPEENKALKHVWIEKCSVLRLLRCLSLLYRLTVICNKLLTNLYVANEIRVLILKYSQVTERPLSFTEVNDSDGREGKIRYLKIEEFLV